MTKRDDILSAIKAYMSQINLQQCNHHVVTAGCSVSRPLFGASVTLL